MSVAPFWKPEEIAKLGEIWSRGRSRKAYLEAEFPGRTWSGIVQKAKAEGFKKPGYGLWTHAKEMVLLEIYNSMPQAEIMERLAPHSWHSIVKKASDLGILRERSKRRSEFAVVRELRRIRRSRRLAIDAVAKRYNSYGSSLSLWETGRRVPSLRGFLDWVAALDLEIVFQRKGFVAQQATSLMELPGKHRMMSRSASVSARRTT